MWEDGTIIIDNIELKYSAKVFDESSKEYGINGGRISKLQVVNGDNWSFKNTIINYDRGWDIKPGTELAKKALEKILRKYDEKEK